MSIAEKVLTLLTVGRRAFGEADILSLKNRFLFALSNRTLTPLDLCECLRQDKTNVAHLAAALEKEGLIEKETVKSDKRRVRYRLNSTGRSSIEATLRDAEERFLNLLNSEEAKSKAEQTLDEAIRLFSFL